MGSKRRAQKKQTYDLQHNARAYNANLCVLTTAMDAFLTAKQEGLDPYSTVFAAVPEATLAATVGRAKALVRPIDLDSLEPKYARMRNSLLTRNAALKIQAVRGADCARDALDYVQDLAQHKRRVTRKQQRVAGETRLAMTMTAHEYITDRHKQITGLPWIAADAQGKLHLAALTAAHVPDGAQRALPGRACRHRHGAT
jgi:hypothetical protein